MKSFEYAAPTTLKEATALLSDQWGETEILAGGTDLVTSLKQHLTAPSRVVGPKDKRTIAAAEFFQTPKSAADRETALKPNEILAEIEIPLRDLKNATYEVRHRHGLDWPYATASVAFALKGGTASDARVVLGQVAPAPWSAVEAAK